MRRVFHESRVSNMKILSSHVICSCITSDNLKQTSYILYNITSTKPFQCKTNLAVALHKRFLRNPHWIDLIKRENKGINQLLVSMIELLSASRVSIFFPIRNWTEPVLTSAHSAQPSSASHSYRGCTLSYKYHSARSSLR